MGLLDAPGVTPRAFKRLRRRDLPGAAGIPGVAAVLPDITLSAANAATAITGGASRSPRFTECFRYYGCTPTPDANGAYQSNYQLANLNSPSGSSPWAIEWISDSPKFEILTRGTGSPFRLMADGAYLSYSGCYAGPADGATYRVLVDWTTQLPAAQARTLRHYRLEAYGQFPFAGLYLPNADTVTAPAYKGQRVIIFGDSFSEPTVNDSSLARTFADAVTTSGSATLTSPTAAFTQYDRYSTITGTGIPANTWIKSVQSATSITLSAPATASATVSATLTQQFTRHEGWGGILGKMLGCPDVWHQGSGGTGYLNPGTGGRVAFPTRFAHDVIVPAPDVVFIAGGVNDAGRSVSTGYTAAACGTVLAGMLSSIKAALPNCEVNVVSPFLGHMGSLLQPGGIADNYAQIRDALRDTATAAGIRFIDVIESGVTGQTSTVATASSGSGLIAADAFAQGAILRVGTSVDGWTCRVQSAPTGTGPYTHSISPNFTKTWPVSTPVAVVGSAFLVGTGVQGTPTGDGNADYFVGADNTHPTLAGHNNLGRFVFKMYAASLAP